MFKKYHRILTWDELDNFLRIPEEAPYTANTGANIIDEDQLAEYWPPKEIEPI